MNGIIGRKIGMTSVFNDAGQYVACTVIEATPNLVTQVKTTETDGYDAVQLGFGSKKDKNVPNAMKGHFKKSGGTARRKLIEFRNSNIDKKEGDELRIEDLFEEGDVVNAIGTSKGKGFQGVVKRHKFRGVNDATHGQHNRQRAPGSLGAGSTPSKVIKGMKMAGQMGNVRVKTKNLKIVRILPEKNLLLVKGSVPGSKGSMVIIEK